MDIEHNYQISKDIVVKFQELMMDGIDFCSYVNNYNSFLQFLVESNELNKNIKSALVEVSA